MLEFLTNHWVLSSIVIIYLVGFLIAAIMGYGVFRASIWPLLLWFILFGNIQ